MTREEALNEIRSWAIPSKKGREVLETLIPELAESEDERIRKRLIEYFEGFRMGNAEVKWEGLTVQEVLAWLEKREEPHWCHHRVDLSNCSEEYMKAYYDGWNNCNQQHSQYEAEQKPMEKPVIQEKNNEVMKAIEDIIRVYGKTQGGWIAGYDMDTLVVHLRKAFAALEKQKEHHLELYYDKELDNAAREFYLSGGAASPVDSTGLVPIVRMAEFGATWMKERMEKEQKPAEWSEEDGKKIIFLERLIRYNVPEGQYGWTDGHKGGFVTKLEAISMLKSLRPVSKESLQPHWKPSEEQMDAVKHAYNSFPNDCSTKSNLRFLYHDLEKLGVREEPEYYQHFDPDC